MLKDYAGEKNNTNSEEERGGIHLSGVWCLPSVFFWSCLWLFISSSSRGGSSNFCQHLHLPVEGASIVVRRVGPLGLPEEVLFSLLGKLWVCSPAPALPVLVCPTLFPIMYGFC